MGLIFDVTFAVLGVIKSQLELKTFAAIKLIFATFFLYFLSLITVLLVKRPIKQVVNI